MADATKVDAIWIVKKKLFVVHDRFKDHLHTLGGNLEQGESERKCLEREVMEEIGCKVEQPYCRGEIICNNFNNTKNIRHRLYTCFVVGEPRFRPDDETDGFAWVDRHVIDRHANELKLSNSLKYHIIPWLIRRYLM
jgi:8-oxo-dGTP pyrophosphatase MutT (NUDIX family)